MSYHATKCSMPTLSPRSRHLLKLWRENFWANLQDSLLDKDRRHERQRLAFADRRTDRRNGSFFLRLLLSFASCGFHTTDGSLFCEVSKASFTKMMLATSTPTATTTRKANLFESMALGGAAASFAVNFTHPIETVKTRMQVSGSSISATVSELAGKEGIAAFWKGLTFAYGRELSYTSVKLGAYAPVRDAMGAGKDAPFYLKFLAGAITGGVGSAIGNPFDVMKTLAQTNKDKAAPLMTLVKDMYSKQGMAGFYRGVEANVMRACVLNATKMGCYDISKGYVMEATGWQRKDIRTSFSSAFIAGFLMTCTVSPFDRIRTNLMNQPTTGEKLYNGFIDCTAKTIQKDGVASLWRGFIPIWARFAPQATLQLLTIEFLYTACGFKSI